MCGPKEDEMNNLTHTPGRGDVRLALDSLGRAIERAGDSGAGVSEMIGLGVAVRVLAEMLPTEEVWDDHAEVDDELCPF